MQAPNAAVNVPVDVPVKATVAKSVFPKRLLVLVTICFALVACESDEKRRVAAAQDCLDKADSTSAHLCREIVAGLDSEKAYLVRCSVHYLQQGFTGERFANAFKNIEKKDTASDPMLTAMAIMTFNSLDTANLAMADCTRSGVTSMLRLATMTKLATLTASFTLNLGGVDPSDGLSEAEMLAAVQNFPPGGEAALGEVAVQAHTAYCGTGSSYSNNEICTNLGGAMTSGSSTATIGAALLAALQAND